MRFNSGEDRAIQQLDSIFTQAGAVQNTWYTAYTGTARIRVYALGIGCSVINETLEWEITIDGIVYSGSIVATFGTGYYPHWYPSDYANTGTLAITISQDTGLFLPEGAVTLIRIRKTTAAGASALFHKMSYALLV